VFLTRCPGKHLFSRRQGSAAEQIGNVARNSKEERQWRSMRDTRMEREMFRAEGSALTPSITHLMRRCGAIVLLLRGNGRDLDFTVWSLCFPLLGWHLLSLFPAFSLSSPLTGTNAFVSVCHHLHVQDSLAVWLFLINLPLPSVHLMKYFRSIQKSPVYRQSCLVGQLHSRLPFPCK